MSNQPVEAKHRASEPANTPSRCFPIESSVSSNGSPGHSSARSAHISPIMPNGLYYRIKPLLPFVVRLTLRRWLARWKRSKVQNVWPILPGSEVPPKGWQGWPDSKKFAVVLTHDVEGQVGVDRCPPLMSLEQSAGFRSSYNFVPQGTYNVSSALRADLERNGFEVGVHDLKHDGFLYRSREGFRADADCINGYLRQWGASGFRSGFMLHNLAWFEDLNVLYDASTFDTDPFEPQPDGVGTIFPFWVPGENGRGYVEMPYTLVQDFNLFMVLQEKTIEVWKRKVDWIAAHGGMVLVIVHPDYVNFTDKPNRLNEFPAARYQELLDYVKTRYSGQYWHALPREVATYIAKFKPQRRNEASSATPAVASTNGVETRR